MRTSLLIRCCAALALLVACGGADKGTSAPPPPAEPTWDLTALGVPRFVTRQYVDLARIQRVSRFRSGIGHDFSDGTERCRSMKHYFEPFASTDWSTVPVFAPVDGTVRFLLQESGDTKVTIRSSQYPAFMFEVFHVRLAGPLAVGTTLAAGQLLGTHVGSHTYSDVAVVVLTPQGQRLVSWFEALTDAAWQAYVDRGAGSRSAFIISRAERDADPLGCSGQAPFPRPGSIPNWVVLSAPSP